MPLTQSSLIWFLCGPLFVYLTTSILFFSEATIAHQLICIMIPLQIQHMGPTVHYLFLCQIPLQHGIHSAWCDYEMGLEFWIGL